jgi:sigma-B regulation protein RsbU (phosphoserine phosphatase)
MLLLYRDGVPEAMDPDGQLCEESRMLDVNKASSPDSVEALVNVTADGVWAFQSTAEQADDVTVLALRYRGPAGDTREE